MGQKLPLTISQLDIEVLKGKGYRLPLTWGLSGAPYDLTGFKARFKARQNIDLVPAIDLTEGNGIELSDTAPNIVVTIPAASTQDLDISSLLYGLEVEDTSQVVTPLLMGKLELIESIV